MTLIEIDKLVFKFFNETITTHSLDVLMLMLSSNFFYAVVVVILCLYGVKTKNWKLLIVLLIAAACGGITDYMAFEWLKPLFARPRPCHADRLFVRVLDGCAGAYGFPSNHATNSAAVTACMFYYMNWRWGLLALLIAVAIGLSRIYIGVHYPLDILGGFVFGGAMGLVICIVFRPLMKMIFAKTQIQY